MPEPAHPVAVPPTGPGVRPPFAAAPTEGRSARLWLGLGAAGAVLAVCCGVGAVALVGFFVTNVQALQEQADQAADEYLSALVAAEWQRAYALRCEADRASETLPEFTRRVSALPRIQSYELGELNISGSDLELPATLTHTDGTRQEVLIPMEPDQDTAVPEVCGFQR